MIQASRQADSNGKHQGPHYSMNEKARHDLREKGRYPYSVYSRERAARQSKASNQPSQPGKGQGAREKERAMAMAMARARARATGLQRWIASLPVNDYYN